MREPWNGLEKGFNEIELHQYSGASYSGLLMFFSRRNLRSLFCFLQVIALMLPLAGKAQAQPQTPSYFILPQGSWEEKSGTTVLKIFADNHLELSFTGSLSGQSCKVQVFGALRSEFTARPGDCQGLQYELLYFAFQGKELILTLVNPGENFREIIFVPEGSQKDAPDI